MERKLITVAVATALGLPMAAVAVEGSVSGHVNAAITKVDDSDATLGSGNGSETRFRFKGSEELDNGLTAGVTLEVGAGGGAYGYSADGRDFRVRHANVSLSSAAGKLTIGQQGRPSGGANYADVGSTWIAGATNWCSYGISGGAACTTNDASRGQVIRYDTPAIGALSIAASAGNDDFWDAAATISGSAGDAGYNLRLGFRGDDGNEAIIASGAVTVGTIGVALAWSDGDESNGRNNESMFAKLDHTYGDGSVAVYYRRGEVDGDEGSLWGVAVAHSLGGGTTAYAGYRVVDNDGEDEVDGVLAGVRVTFN
jgi:predicted porin